TLSDPNDTWGTGTGGVGEAIFDIYYKDSLGNWVNADETDHFTPTNGVLKVDGLPLGTYYAVEVQAPNGYLLDQTPIKFVLDGTTNAVQTYTFPNDKKLTVTKEVVTEGDDTGNIYNWKITADIPGNAQNLISYAVTDKYENQKDVTITSVVATNGTNTLTLASTDYTTSTGTGTLTVTLTSEGIAKLDPYTSLEINVTSTIADDYSTGKVVNESSITYKYAYDPDDNDPNDEIPDDIPEPSDTYPTTISYPDPVNPEPDADNAKDEFTPATITISNYETGKSVELSGGVYEISRCSQHKDSDYSDDVVTLANLAPGEYTIKQLATKSGYYVEEDAAKNTKTIYIDKDGTVYEGTEASHTTVLANNKVIFYNDPTVEGFNLPFTGTTATIVFTIAGIGVMGGALFFFIFFKKRDKDEEDKENA
ncbi:MAG: isopeptide-forming domain-containing fimbrial protein, partial [Ruminococcus sp.]|nr:isopeptide-forming domain-containing fimbrial protein [Ruminococcus sp.]